MDDLASDHILRRTIEAGERMREEALSLLTPEARARFEEAELMALDRVIYGNSYVDADGRRIDPRRIAD